MSRKTVGIREGEHSGPPVVMTTHGQAVGTLVPTLIPSATPQTPRIVALTSLKGGVGKTTLTMHLASAIALEQDHVVVLDADEEVSAFRWQQHAQADGIELPFRVIPAERNTLMRQARDLAKSGHTVIIDTPPNNREILKSAATVADVVLVPVLPTGMDVDRLATTLELLTDLEAALESFNYAIVLNRFDARKAMAHEANDALNAHPRLNTVVKSLSAYEKVFGQCPTELAQFTEIWNEIKEVFGDEA